MKKINTKKITKTIIKLCAQANFNLRKDVLSALKSAYRRKTKPRAKMALKAIIDNASVARKEKLAICQDTGLPVVFLEVGQNVQITGGDLNKAIQKGIDSGYRKSFLRNSIIKDPLNRRKSEFSPGVIHINFVKGNRLKITVLPKGFGCENKSLMKMFNPTVGIDTIKKFIVDAVKAAGPDACPPYILGIGIGGTFDKAASLSKEALTLPIDKPNPKRHLKKLEEAILKDVNTLGLGPMGLLGNTTCLGVNILECPTHIAGLPVAVNIGCHATRSASLTI